MISVPVIGLKQTAGIAFKYWHVSFSDSSVACANLKPFWFQLRAALLNAFDDDLSDEDSDLSHGQGTSVLSEEAGKNIQTDNNR